ncbi:hypothetical protein GCM10023084_35690 [Streptomyces lacrimifluminis]|uniref:Uncharacterized protein n=1 Tax=Streptomyces lacrimifluminis TaxID=1500077 RepID=A0A917NX69_9ACTN|nr:hypothetical protein GCM10012282_38260 [Streptomyces lacrimifluminis]
MDGLAGAGIAGVAALQLRVDRGEGGTDPLADGTREARHDLLLLALPHPEPSIFRTTESTIRMTKLALDLHPGQHRLEAGFPILSPGHC